MDDHTPVLPKSVVSGACGLHDEAAVQDGVTGVPLQRSGWQVSQTMGSPQNQGFDSQEWSLGAERLRKSFFSFKPHLPFL